MRVRLSRAPARPEGRQLSDATAIEARLRRPLRLTLAGLWAERLVQAFWPLWTVLLATLTALAFGAHEVLPIEAVWVGLVAVLAATGWTLAAGLRGFRAPSPAEAAARLDATLPGQPLAALADRQAIGRDDPAARAVWSAHRARMAARAATATAVPPDLRLARRDPYGLRYVALTGLVMAALFGSFWRAATVTGLAPGSAEALIGGPSWEGWMQPPVYTGRPTLYMNEIAGDSVRVPVGTRVQVRLYGEIGALTLTETVSGRAGTDVPAASEPAQDFEVRQAGQVQIDGEGGRRWTVAIEPDAAPVVRIAAAATRESDGRMRLPFTAEDDYGVTAGRAIITLDLAAVDRRYGLAADPEPREPLVLDLPMPFTGDRKAIEEALIDDVSKHPFANLPVRVSLTVADAPGQEGRSAEMAMVLPGKRFFDPLAAALIEVRRDLLWNRVNGPRSRDILRAITYAPEGFIRNERAFLRLRVAMRSLAANADSLTPVLRDDLAEQLWQVALMVEEGDLANALERLRRAQDRLDEAIRNGADPAEIEELMQEMRQALEEYMRELAEESQRNPDQQMSQDFQGMEFSGDQLQQMLDELQRLMEEGRTAEAAELMEMMRQLMENMQVTEGQGQGQGQQGNPSMRGLGEMLRDQQQLSDDAFRELQEGFGNPFGEGRPEGGERPGEQGRGEGERQGPLDRRQGDLRDRLDRMQEGRLPGDGTEQGEAGRQALEEAERAMREAEEALREGDLPGALDRQAEAMEALREGMRNFGEALAEEQRRQSGQAQEGEEYGMADPNGQRDPLGREPGNSARIGSDENLMQGDDVYRRAEELLGEIRRRQGELERPDDERDYLRRLLDLF